MSKEHNEEEYVEVKVKKSTLKYEKDLESLQIELLKDCKTMSKHRA